MAFAAAEFHNVYMIEARIEIDKVFYPCLASVFDFVRALFVTDVPSTDLLAQ